jgi:chromosome partitioning protein
MTCRKLSIFNMKGGVAKSTTAYNLAIGLKKFFDKKVLLVDIDPQGNATAAVGIDISNLEKQIKDVLLRQATIESVIVTANDIDIVPANIFLALQEIPISGIPGRELLLKKAIAPVEKKYDFILIDCPPNIGVFSVNALMASDSVIIPVDMSYLGLLGISAIEIALNLIRTELDHPIKIAGVLATKYDGRNNISREVLDALKNRFQEQMFQTIIPETVKIKEAPSFGISIFEHNPKGLGATAYRSLVEEVISGGI